MEIANQSVSYGESSYYEYTSYPKHFLHVEIAISTVVWLVYSLAVAGNILVFVVILGDRRLRSNVANLYILNLASADLSVGLVSVFFNNLWRYFDHWPFGRGLCTLWTVVDGAACLQGAWAVTLISLDRYIMVSRYLLYRRHQTKKLAALLIAATWSISILIHTVAVLGNDHWAGFLVYGPVDYSVVCDFGVLYFPPYSLSKTTLAFAVPMLAVACLNLGVFRNILRRSKRVQPAAGNPRQGLTLQRAPAAGPSHQQPRPAVRTVSSAAADLPDPRPTLRRHRRAAVMLAVIVGAFTVCWTPYHALQVTYTVGRVRLPWSLWNASYYTVWANSALNPFIYFATNPLMRQSLLRMACGRSVRVRPP